LNTILVVDDDEIFRETLTSYLASKWKNYKVMAAEDGEKAIEILQANAVSLIITDLIMPYADGYKVIAFASTFKPTIPLIIMTAAWSLELASLVSKMGVVRYIEKPFHKEDIDRIVGEAISCHNESCSVENDNL